MKVLVFRTSSDDTMRHLFMELGDEHAIDCLIQSSQFEQYRMQYPKINFIDIQQEVFVDLSKTLLDAISEKQYDRIYVTVSGVVAHNYGNVMQILACLKSRSSFFYNCHGKQIEIPQRNLWKDTFWSLYIHIVEWVYRHA